MDERDARENRIREQRDREIAQLPEDEQPAALQAEKELREKYQADKQLLLEARRGTILAENGRASGRGLRHHQLLLLIYGLRGWQGHQQIDMTDTSNSAKAWGRVSKTGSISVRRKDKQRSK